jgi:hypothetical protein
MDSRSLQLVISIIWNATNKTGAIDRSFLLDIVRHISSNQNSGVNNMVCILNFLAGV